MPLLSVYTPKYMKIDYWVVGVTNRVFQLLIIFYIVWDLSVKQAWAYARRPLPSAAATRVQLLLARRLQVWHAFSWTCAGTRRRRWAQSTPSQAVAPRLKT